jgi:hypothetical protein
VPFREADLFLAEINCLSAKRSNEQLINFRSNDLEELIKDGRGGYFLTFN